MDMEIDLAIFFFLSIDLAMPIVPRYGLDVPMSILYSRYMSPSIRVCTSSCRCLAIMLMQRTNGSKHEPGLPYHDSQLLIGQSPPRIWSFIVASSELRRKASLWSGLFLGKTNQVLIFSNERYEKYPRQIHSSTQFMDTIYVYRCIILVPSLTDSPATLSKLGYVTASLIHIHDPESIWLLVISAWWRLFFGYILLLILYFNSFRSAFLYLLVWCFQNYTYYILVNLTGEALGLEIPKP